jgi:hypothetical protein
MDPTTGQDKVYSNETISDQPFPVNPDQVTVTDTSGQTPSGNTPSSAATIPQQTFPVQIVAQELLSTALNTRTKKVIQEFQFAPEGAIQVGEFEPGVSGDIRISPEGIVARNQEGDTTLAIDAETGDAIFAGEVRENSTITGKVTVIDGGYILLEDSSGIPNIFIGQTPL